MVLYIDCKCDDSSITNLAKSCVIDELKGTFKHAFIDYDAIFSNYKINGVYLYFPFTSNHLAITIRRYYFDNIKTIHYKSFLIHFEIIKRFLIKESKKTYEERLLNGSENTHWVSLLAEQ